ncbi:MAG: isocitrate lyase/PEP mutase family protein [Steroidobacteraceae bacterium]
MKSQAVQAETARRFASLHVKGDPVVLYNIWDAGSARAVAKAGARAIATGSWSVAAAHGFEDGESIPLEFVEQIVRRIAAAVDLPVTVDFEGGYDASAEGVARNVARVIAAGAVGINFEDRIVGGAGLHPVAEQSRRIAAIRRASDDSGVALFINARTDLFLQAADARQHGSLISEAGQRAASYRDAGASGLFVPGLVDEKLIGDLCRSAPLPVNIMMMEGAPSTSRLAELGVARVSYGPLPFIAQMEELERRAAVALRR